MKKVKKVLNIEYELSSDEFKAQKQDDISEKCQAKHGDDYICKVTTFCVPDKQIVISTTQENMDFMGAGNKMLAHRPLAEQSFLNMDDEMLKTYEITITADTDIADYAEAIDIAQGKADEMFEKDDSKIPLVTIIDYRWGNPTAILSASLFGDTDENGNVVPLIGAKDASSNTVGGNIINSSILKRILTLSEEDYWVGDFYYKGKEVSESEKSKCLNHKVFTHGPDNLDGIFIYSKTTTGAKTTFNFEYDDVMYDGMRVGRLDENGAYYNIATVVGNNFRVHDGISEASFTFDPLNFWGKNGYQYQEGDIVELFLGDGTSNGGDPKSIRILSVEHTKSSKNSWSLGSAKHQNTTFPRCATGLVDLTFGVLTFKEVDGTSVILDTMSNDDNDFKLFSENYEVKFQHGTNVITLGTVVEDEDLIFSYREQEDKTFNIYMNYELVAENIVKDDSIKFSDVLRFKNIMDGSISDIYVIVSTGDEAQDNANRHCNPTSINGNQHIQNVNGGGTVNKITVHSGHVMRYRLYDTDNNLIPYSAMDLETNYNPVNSYYPLKNVFSADKDINSGDEWYGYHHGSYPIEFKFNTPIEVSRIESVKGLEYDRSSRLCNSVVSINDNAPTKLMAAYYISDVNHYDDDNAIRIDYLKI